jgi:hypothetical protein
MLLALAGKFPGDGYTDIRVGPADKIGITANTVMEDVEDSLDWNLGRMPCCEADGVSIGQGT